ncbi:MAG: hypothetical protein AVDCRST_MAG68-2294, partial [uncultured Gemmatimonadetes bacterium]
GISLRGGVGRPPAGRHQPAAHRRRVGRRGDVAGTAGGPHAPLARGGRLQGRPLPGGWRDGGVFAGEHRGRFRLHPALLRAARAPRQGRGEQGDGDPAEGDRSPRREDHAGRAGEQPGRPPVLALRGVHGLRDPHGAAAGGRV